MPASIKDRNYSIDFFRIIFALGVVAIHAHPFEDINETVNFIFVDVFSRLAVPFFFTVAGYYFTKRMDEKRPAKPYVLKLLRVYLVWSAVYGVFYFVLQVVSGAKISSVLSGLLRGLFFGVSEHLWFFPALFMAIALFWCFCKLHMQKFIVIAGAVMYTVCVLSSAYSKLLFDIPFIELFCKIDYEYIRILFVAFPYLSLGYLLKRTDNIKINNKKLFALLSVVFILYAAEKVIIEYNSFGRSHVNTFLLYFVVMLVVRLLLNNSMPVFRNVSAPCRNIANFTYYAHPVFLEITRFLLPLLLKTEGCQTISYVLTCILTVGVGYLVNKNGNKLKTFLM